MHPELLYKAFLSDVCLAGVSDMDFCLSGPMIGGGGGVLFRYIEGSFPHFLAQFHQILVLHTSHLIT